MFIDFHSHILPGVDDGAKSVDESIDMLLLEKEQGIDVVVATPHFYTESNTIEKFLADRQRAYQNLMDAAAARALRLPQILLGAEVSFSVDILELTDIERLCIGDTRTILLEMPFTQWGPWVYDEVYRLLAGKGLKPVIAHLERYSFIKFEMIEKLLQMDLSVQLNAEAFVLRENKKIMARLMRGGYVDVIGSDAHNMTVRKSCLDAAIRKIEKKYGRDCVEAFMENACRLLRL